MSLAILRDNSIQKLDTYTDSDRSSTTLPSQGAIPGILRLE